MGQTEHKPDGWPNSIKWENWKSHTSKKEHSRLIIKSILNFHGITDLENFDASGQGEAACIESPDIVNSSVENAADKSTIESEDGGKESRKKQKIDDDYYDSDPVEELSLSLHDSDTETEEESSPPKMPRIVLSEAEKRREKNIQEREQLWEQQKDIYENMFK